MTLKKPHLVAAFFPISVCFETTSLRTLRIALISSNAAPIKYDSRSRPTMNTSVLHHLNHIAIFSEQKPNCPYITLMYWLYSKLHHTPYFLKSCCTSNANFYSRSLSTVEVKNGSSTIIYFGRFCCQLLLLEAPSQLLNWPLPRPIILMHGKLFFYTYQKVIFQPRD